MASEMVERVARAMVKADEIKGGPPWDVLAELGMVQGVLDAAAAGIAAMREPTEAMINSAWADHPVLNKNPYEGPMPEDSWQSMIDEALK